MTEWYCSVCHNTVPETDKPDKCSSCNADERMIMESGSVPGTLEQVRDRARKKLKGFCAAYPYCNGSLDRICQKEAYGRPIGFGGAGQGLSFAANSEALSEIRFNTSVVGENFDPDTSFEFLGMDLDFPVLASSTAGVGKYNDSVDETLFCKTVLKGSQEAGTIGLRGDTWFYSPEGDNPALEAIQECGGWGIPVFKPRPQDVLKRLIDRALEIGARAVGIDLDGCGSVVMAAHGQKVFKKSVREIEELVDFSSLPFIAKGIMTPEDAQKCVDAGVSVVAVSNHGGRVMDSTPGVAEVLPLIRERLGNSVAITADGGVRTGYDVLKMLALGADAVLLGRDIIRAALGAGTLGVRLHLEHIKKILKKAMFMTGTRNIKKIDPGIIFRRINS